MRSHARGHFTEQLREFAARRLAEILGAALLVTAGALTLALVSWSARDPSLNHATSGHVRNLLGGPGAIVSDLLMQLVGFGAIAAIVPVATQGLRLMRRRRIGRVMLRVGLCVLGVFATAATASLLPATNRWPLPTGLGGVAGDAILTVPRLIFAGSGVLTALFGAGAALVAILAVTGAAGLGFESEADMRSRSSEDDAKIRPGADDDDDAGGEPGVALISLGALIHLGLALKAWMLRAAARLRRRAATTDRPPPPRYPRVEPTFEDLDLYPAFASQGAQDLDEPPFEPAVAPSAPAPRRTRAPARAAQPRFNTRYETPPLTLLAEPKKQASGVKLPQEALEHNARLLEGVLEDFSVKGDIINVRPGPVVTLYELEPAPGIKSSRVIGLADDIARSMSAISARVAVVSGRNAIGIELPNQRRETVYLRELHRLRGFRPLQPQARHRAWQDDRRRAGDRRPGPHAASSGRRHHRLRQVGRDQHHDPVAALSAEARRVPAHHGRSEDAGALRLRQHSPSADARRHRPEKGGRGAQMGGARDGGSLQENVEARRAQHRRLQRPRRRRAGQGRDDHPHGADRLRPRDRRGDLRA